MNVAMLRAAPFCAEEVGAKAAILADLATRGFQVPEAFIVLPSVQQRMLSAAGVPLDTASGLTPSDGQVRDALLRGTWPADVRRDISDHIARLKLGDCGLVVRSSAAGEDGATRSFAGQYLSVMGVHGVDGVRAACAQCWASGFSRRVLQYDSQGEPGGMSLIVQELVTPVWAGVALTAHPLTGDRSRVVIESVPGSASGVCAGTADPVRHWADKTSGEVAAEVIPAGASAMTARVVRAVADAAVAVEQCLGTVADVEWAVCSDGGPDVTILQARPMTGLAVRERTRPQDDGRAIAMMLGSLR